MMKRLGMPCLLAACLLPLGAAAQDNPGIPTIAQMQALGTASAGRKAVRVQSYAAGSPVGGGPFSWVAGACVPDGGIWFAAKGVSAATGCWRRDEATATEWHSAWFGAIPDKTGTDYTARLRACADKASAARKTCIFDAGSYVGTVANFVAVMGTAYGGVMSAFPLSSNYSVTLAPGFTYKLANGQAQIAHDRRLAIGFFNTSRALANVSIRGAGAGRSVLDMNGQNNRISGGTGWNQPFIEASGNASRMDNLLVRGITFKNAPGTNVIVHGQTVNGVSAPLGKGFTIADNQFIDGGLDTADHTAIYAYATDGVASDNEIRNALFWGASATNTGCNTAYEIHGSRQKFVFNRVKGCQRGVWIAGNFTEPTQDSLVQNNQFETVISAVDLFRNTPGEQKVERALIADNKAVFNNDVPVGFPVRSQTKGFTNISTIYPVSDIVISGNQVVSPQNAAIATYGFNVSPRTTPGGSYERIEIRGNSCTGATVCVNAATNAVNGIGHLTIRGNRASQLSPSRGGGPGTTAGIRITPTGAGIGVLNIEENDVSDGGQKPLTDYGVLVERGPITRLLHKPGRYAAPAVTGDR